MTNWRPDPAQLRRPVYLSLVEQFEAAMESGRLGHGDRLPTHRRLARELGVSIQTVSRAYEELARRGRAAGQTGRGTFVSAKPSEPAPPYIPERHGEIIDLSMLKPVCEQMHLDRMAQALSVLSASLPSALVTSFRPNVALARHRDVAVQWLRRCGVEAKARNVLITNGATPAISVALMAAARPGALIATEALGHHTLVAVASYLGLHLRGVAIDRQGIVPEALERLCRDEDVSAVFLLPNAANPTVAFMGAERRGAIAEIARRHDLQLIENDAWGPLIEERPPPLAALAPERTQYITSFTKLLAPGLRVGYLVVPDRLFPAAGNRHLVTSWMATGLMAEIATRWVEDGTAAALVEWQRDAMRRRQALAADALAGNTFFAHRESLHMWVPLPEGRSEEDFVSLARLQGVAVAPGSAFTIAGAHPPAVRVCLGQPSEEELRLGLSVIGSILQSEPESVLLSL